jgi:hypothetical protein
MDRQRYLWRSLGVLWAINCRAWWWVDLNEGDQAYALIEQFNRPWWTRTVEEREWPPST